MVLLRAMELAAANPHIEVIGVDLAPPLVQPYVPARFFARTASLMSLATEKIFPQTADLKYAYPTRSYIRPE